MGVYIRDMTIEEFAEYGGEYAGYLIGTGQAEGISDYGDLIDREALVALWEKDIVDNKERGITDCTYTDMEQIYREFIYDAKMFHAVIPAERSEE